MKLEIQEIAVDSSIRRNQYVLVMKSTFISCKKVTRQVTFFPKEWEYLLIGWLTCLDEWQKNSNDVFALWSQYFDRYVQEKMDMSSFFLANPQMNDIDEVIDWDSDNLSFCQPEMLLLTWLDENGLEHDVKIIK